MGGIGGIRRSVALFGVCAGLAACMGSGEAEVDAPAPDRTEVSLAERYDAATEMSDRVQFRATSVGPTTMARLPRGGASYEGHAGFVTAADDDALEQLLDRDLVPEDVRWISSVTLTADFERDTINAQFDDFVGQRNTPVAGTLRMPQTAIRAEPGGNAATFSGRLRGTLTDADGPVVIAGDTQGVLVGNEAEAVLGEVMGTATRPDAPEDTLPESLGGIFFGER